MTMLLSDKLRSDVVLWRKQRSIAWLSSLCSDRSSADVQGQLRADVRKTMERGYDTITPGNMSACLYDTVRKFMSGRDLGSGRVREPRCVRILSICSTARDRLWRCDRGRECGSLEVRLSPRSTNVLASEIPGQQAGSTYDCLLGFLKLLMVSLKLKLLSWI